MLQHVIAEGSQGMPAVMEELPCNNIGVKSLGNYFANECIRVSRAAALHSEKQVTGGLRFLKERIFVFWRGSRKIVLFGEQQSNWN